jgi:hypothetical protein
MSSSQTAISEIGVSYPDETFGDEDPFGVPFVVSIAPQYHIAQVLMRI